MFKLPPLPFAADALEPAMSRMTLETHHGKHHAAYIKKMNAALEGRSDAPDRLEDVVRLAVRVIVHDQGDMLEEGAERLVILHRAGEFGEVLEAAGAFGLARLTFLTTGAGPGITIACPPAFSIFSLAVSLNR